MAHACLMRSASNILMKTNTWQDVEPAVRAARHARQTQDITHAVELYLQLVADKPNYPHYWRELSTCLKDIHRDWAVVCLNKAVVLDPRSSLTLLSKGAMLFEEDPATAEPFFFALLKLNPNWATAWACASVYFYERELYHLADTIMQYAETLRKEQHPEARNYSRSWERELGDWWDSTPLLPGMSLYYEAADLLLRLRAMPLAEACLARLLSVTGETTAYYHLVALCCRLRGQYKEAICHLTVGLDKFGEVGKRAIGLPDGRKLRLLWTSVTPEEIRINYLRSLEAECQHRLGNAETATASYAKVGTCVSSFSILMSLSSGDNTKTRSILMELIRRQASAYAWTALADDWMRTHITNPEEEVKEGVKNTEEMNAKECAIACAVQALKIDRRAGRAWAILGKLVKPSARRLHCLQMANSVAGSPPTWNGTFTATRGNVACYQYFSTIRKPIGQEDCLVLNIYTPPSRSSELYSVIVFIHGGGFSSGSNSKLIYNPQFLVKDNVIVVTINYRIGAFGFLCLGIKEAPGNIGLKDQLAALKWIQNNIAYFGGNPNSVTIFGESAGAVSVHYLVLTNSAEGLFHRAIMDSGSVLMPQDFKYNPIESASIVATRLGYKTSDPKELLQIFRNSTASDIVEASYADQTNDAFSVYYFTPCVETVVSNETEPFITEEPTKIIKREYLNVSAIIGVNNREGIYWAQNYNYQTIEQVRAAFGSLIPNYLLFESDVDRTNFVDYAISLYFSNRTVTDGLIEYFTDSLDTFNFNNYVGSKWAAIEIP
ncbi:unnamed protein product [Spodoptera exigua]|nr:unnamed protein product [Spodoptera exigua]